MNEREQLGMLLMIVAFAVAVVAFTFYFLDIGTRVGPGCPGDPEWLGWCSEVDGS